MSTARFVTLRAMSWGLGLVLFFACGAATFPLLLLALRAVAALAPGAPLARSLRDNFDRVLTLAFVLWLASSLAFYVGALLLERQKPCKQQQTHQLTDDCRDRIHLGLD
jgi:hypothetical protein